MLLQPKVPREHQEPEKLQGIGANGFTPASQAKKAAAKHRAATQHFTHPWNLPPPGFPNLSGLAINTSVE